MPLVILNEYENQNARRKFPFSDNATLTDNEGHALPVDFLIDAHLYPLGLTGFVYISSIDLTMKTIYFADSMGGTFGKAVYTAEATEAEVVEIDGYERSLGVVVFGAGLLDLVNGRTTRTFTALATQFTPTAYTPINQVGVRGILLPDGTLVTGEVTIEGRDGVLATSRIEDGQHILRFDVIGVPDTESCPVLDPPICTIIVERKSGSRFIISKYDEYSLALTLNGLDLDTICNTARARRRPSDRDVCEDPPPPDPPVPPGTDDEITYRICEMAVSSFMIVAPSTLGYRNPIGVLPIDQKMGAVKAPANRMTTSPGMSIEDLEKAADKFRLPDAMPGGIIIEVQGIGKGQLP